jgi:hypothetical protein
VLNADDKLARQYQEALADSSPYERLLALHDSPLEIAAMLADVPVTDDIRARYDELQARLRAEASVDTARLPKTNYPVTRQQLSNILSTLGYAPVQGADDQFQIWERPEYKEEAPVNLPRLITVPAPGFRANQFLESVYDRSFVIDLLTSIGGASLWRTLRSMFDATARSETG